MTYRATSAPRVGGFQLLVDFFDRELIRIQRAFASTPDIEQGEFTPTFDFATTGDLSNSYATQDGQYWRVGPLLHYSLLLTVTPTFTTSAGMAKVGGLPYASEATAPYSVVSSLLLGANITWPAGTTAVAGFIRSGNDYIETRLQGSLTDGVNVVAADVASGNELSVYSSGFYPMK